MMVSLKALAVYLLPLAFALTSAQTTIPTEYGDDYCDEEPSTSSSAVPTTTSSSSSITTLLTTTTTSSSSSAAPSSSSSPALSGRGYFNGIYSGGQKGCLITAGTWYAGTCAYYTPVPVSGTSGGFTLNTSRGPCDVIGSALVCQAGGTSGTFTQINGYLAYQGSTAFYAQATPNPAQTVYVTSQSVPVTFQWQQGSS